jgi:putative membrane protein
MIFERLIRNTLTLTRLEAGFFVRYPRLLLGGLVVALIPALYVLIYLSSVWDPASKTGDLPVAIVNLDQGLAYRGQAFNVGRDVARRLRAKPAFGYLDFTDEPEARRLVRRGVLAFALIIPADFSSNAVPGARVGAGKLEVYTSEGNSYPSAGLARRFAEDLGREVNQSLNEQRWALVLADAAGSSRELERLHGGLVQLRKGAKELVGGAQQTARGAEAVSVGASKLEQGVSQVDIGSHELENGLRTLFDKRPRNSDLQRLEDGAQALAAGHDELGKGLVQLQQGVQRMQKGVAGFREEANNSLFVGSQIVEGLDQLGEGTTGLETGLKTAVVSQQKLAEGTSQLAGGVKALTNGVRAFNGGLGSIISQLPDDAKIDDLVIGANSLTAAAVSLKGGTQKVAAGAQHVAGGLELLESALPASVRAIEGNAQGLANSVQPAIEVDAPVQNNGSGFAPNIIPGALWLGASLAAFLFHLRTLPRSASRYSALARMLGKFMTPMGIVLLQAFLIWVTVLWILRIKTVDAGALALTLGVASVTFLMMVFALTRAFGDGGRALALVLLAVQLSSSGGLLPVELSGGFFAQISPYMPITWVVKALKASLFGAFEGDFQHSLQLLAFAGLAAGLMACYVGRWRYVKPAALRPTLDF